MSEFTVFLVGEGEFFSCACFGIYSLFVGGS